MHPLLHRADARAVLRLPLDRVRLDLLRYARENDLFRGSAIMPGAVARVHSCAPQALPDDGGWIVVEFEFSSPPLRLKFSGGEFSNYFLIVN